MFFGPCMADESRIRLIAHLAGDLTAALPYVNATMPQASFNAGPCTLTYMDGHRMVSVSPRRVAIGKADDLVDGWRTLERIRIIVNQAWARRAAIVPSFERRTKPPALEIYKRLPRTNCKACGEETCMAFAASLWQGTAQPRTVHPCIHGQIRRAAGGPLGDLSGTWRSRHTRGGRRMRHTYFKISAEDRVTPSGGP